EDKDKLNKQDKIRKTSQEILQRLYKAQPDARKVVEGAAGYAVFSNTGVKILFGGSGNGFGVAMNNKTRAETFMKMLEFQAGIGMGVKKFSVIFAFDTEKALNDFINNGWQFGGQANASAKAGEGKGGQHSGAASVSDGVWMYQMTEKGL